MLGPDDDQTLLTRLNLARALHDSERVAEAVEEYQGLLDEYERKLRIRTTSTPSRSDTTWRAHCKRPAAWARHSSTIAGVLADEERTLGADHPDVLVTRYSLASALEDSGERCRSGGAVPSGARRTGNGTWDRTTDTPKWPAINCRAFLNPTGTALEPQGQMKSRRSERHSRPR